HDRVGELRVSGAVLHPEEVEIPLLRYAWCAAMRPGQWACFLRKVPHEGWRCQGGNHGLLEDFLDQSARTPQRIDVHLKTSSVIAEHLVRRRRRDFLTESLAHRAVEGDFCPVATQVVLGAVEVAHHLRAEDMLGRLLGELSGEPGARVVAAGGLAG